MLDSVGNRGGADTRIPKLPVIAYGSGSFRPARLVRGAARMKTGLVERRGGGEANAVAAAVRKSSA
jgi:hypothetical protein